MKFAFNPRFNQFNIHRLATKLWEFKPIFFKQSVALEFSGNFVASYSKVLTPHCPFKTNQNNPNDSEKINRAQSFPFLPTSFRTCPFIVLWTGNCQAAAVPTPDEVTLGKHIKHHHTHHNWLLMHNNCREQSMGLTVPQLAG